MGELSVYLQSSWLKHSELLYQLFSLKILTIDMAKLQGQQSAILL